MNIAICIDYDNLSSLQKTAGILDVVQKTLLEASEMFLKNIGTCEVRLYGGWYEGADFSVLSQQISVSIQNDFPNVLRVPNEEGEIIIFRVTAELAVSLLEEPGHQLFNTYRRKGRPNNIRVETPASVGCSTSTCPLPLAKKLLQNGRCPTQGCVTGGGALVYRHEQKLVDTMLTCDLMYLANQAYDLIFIISADDDFLPPIRTLLLRGAKVIRVHPQMSSALVPIKVGTSTLIELGIQ